MTELKCTLVKEFQNRVVKAISFEDATKFASAFIESVIIPTMTKAKSLDQGALSEREQAFVAADFDASTKSLSGFNSPISTDFDYEYYNIVAVLSLPLGNELELDAKVKYNLHGDGPEVTEIDVLFNEDSVIDLLGKTNTEDHLNDLVCNSYDSYGWFDASAKPLTEDDLNKILAILK